MGGRGIWQLWKGLAVGVAVLLGISLLPTDTSLREAQRLGVLSACLPARLVPLVTGDPARPGIEVDLLQEIAAELGLRLNIRSIAAMGRDFDPAGARISRGQCAVLGGGLIDTPSLRGFLDVTSSYMDTGLVAISPSPRDLQGAKAVILAAAVQGIDRTGLSALLRGQGIVFTLTRDRQDMLRALQEDQADIAILGAFDGQLLAAEQGYALQPLPAPFGSSTLVFGLWKGDLTLKRGIERALGKIRQDGRLARIISRYQQPD